MKPCFWHLSLSMSTNPRARAWVELRADALRANYDRIVQSVGPEVGVLPMVKADAYGLGVYGVVKVLEPLDPWGFGVATVSEGVALRHAGVVRPIVVCSPAPADDVAVAVEHDLQLSISSLRALEHTSGVAAAKDRTIGWHLDVDTGMGRSGFDFRTSSEWMPEVSRTRPGLRWVGCYTHLHSADEDADSINRQWSRLEGVLKQSDALPAHFLVHVLNSAGSIRRLSRTGSLVRPGIFLYGGAVGEGQIRPEPLVSLHSRVVHVRDALTGTELGYGSTYAATVDEQWATLSIGYGDGLPRSLSNRGAALVSGRRVPIIGRISMDVTVVNITGILGVAEGTVATLIGEQDGASISVDEVAKAAGTISYEVLTGLTGRLPRVWAAT
mgnify:CR=1 FL=1